MVNELEKIDSYDPLLFTQAINVANDGIIITDYLKRDNPIIFVNRTFEKMSGYSFSEIVNQNCRFLQRDDRNQKGIEIVRKAIEAGESCRVDLRNYRKDGTMFWNELSIAPLKNKKGQITHFVGVQKDITKQKRFEEFLFSQSLEDPLTRLLNRRGFDIKAKQLIETSKREKADALLIMLDLDNFKSINDCYGHSNGDDALIEISRLLRENQREFDILARYGGDEFVQLILERDSQSFHRWQDQLKQKLQNLNAEMKLSFPLSFSIGKSSISFSSNKSLLQAIQEADLSMYTIKKEKKIHEN